MKRTLFTILLTLILAGMCQAAHFNRENLHYIITYKWGLINKDAGEATLSLMHRGDNYDVILAAKTRPWADKIFKVRDTLQCTMKRTGLAPVSYKKITHENDRSDRVEIDYTQIRGITKGDVVKYKYRNGKWTSKKSTLTASGPVFDMLSVFYYLRTLDYDKLYKDRLTYKVTVFSSKSETLTIRCLGKTKIKLRDKTVREAYKLKFNFTTGGRTKSSDDMETWISTDSSHIPLYLVGKLPIGEVRVYFTGKS